jgi:hypothetical protein
MKLRVKQKFLSYEVGDELPISLLKTNPKYYTSQVINNNIEVVTDVPESVIIEPSLKKESKCIISRAKEYIEDLLDDGKRNYSNNPTKKSPGRKMKIIKKK